MAACDDRSPTSLVQPGAPAASRAVPAPVLEHAGPKKIAGQYVVVLNDAADPTAVLGRHAAEPLHTYGTAIKGFAAKLNPGQVQRLQRDPDVKYIEEDGIASIAQGGAPPAGGQAEVAGPRDDASTGSFQVNAPWGLSKLDQHFGSASDIYYDYTNTGFGVKAYVLDTGIHTGHDDFDGAATNRAKAGTLGFDAFGGTGQDCHGHGTHVAGTIIGTKYGVAKRATAFAVRVLDGSGSGSWSGVIAGIDWVAQKHVKPAVANMSLGGGYVQAVNDAVKGAVLYGVPFVVAAGNESTDASTRSPASEPTAITVAASDVNNARASFSNYGSVVDLYGPGVSVLSAWIGSATATNTISGTSMASPHVAGVVALYLEANKTAGPGEVADVITEMGVPGVISGNVGATPNRLAHFHGLFYVAAASSVFPIDNSQFGSGFEYYFANGTGTHKAWLRGEPGINFNLYLQKWSGSSWVTVQTKATSSNNEFVSYTGTAGYYRYIVTNANTTTAGSYDLFRQNPN